MAAPISRPITLSDADAGRFEQLVVAADGAADFEVDLVAQKITAPSGDVFNFDFPAADRLRLLEGLDDIGLTLKHADEIAAHEKRVAGQSPWQQRADIARYEQE